MELDRPHLGAPHEVCHVGRAQRIGTRAVGPHDVGAMYPVRPLAGDALLEEPVGVNALGKAVQVHRSTSVSPQANLA